MRERRWMRSAGHDQQARLKLPATITKRCATQLVNTASALGWHLGLGEIDWKLNMAGAQLINTARALDWRFRLDLVSKRYRLKHSTCHNPTVLNTLKNRAISLDFHVPVGPGPLNWGEKMRNRNTSLRVPTDLSLLAIGSAGSCSTRQVCGGWRLT
jgi:hypothetical protein